MKKNSISDLVADSMLKIMSSEEHKSLFTKQAFHKDEMEDMAWDESHASDCSACGMAKDHCMCGDSSMAWVDDADYNDAKGCHQCGMDTDHCMCGDSAMALDKSASKNDETEAQKIERAYNKSIESLLVASASLDYAGLDKGSELVLKIAALVSEAKKGNVNLASPKSSSSKSSAPTKSSKSSKSSASKSKKSVKKKKMMKKDKLDAKDLKGEKELKAKKLLKELRGLSK